MFVPVVVFFTKYTSIFCEASEFGVELQSTINTSEAGEMPLFIYGHQEVPVHDLPSTSGTDSWFTDRLVVPVAVGLRHHAVGRRVIIAVCSAVATGDATVRLQHDGSSSRELWGWW